MIGIERDHKPVEVATTGASVAIKIQPGASSTNVMATRHFDEDDTIVSLVCKIIAVIIIIFLFNNN